MVRLAPSDASGSILRFAADVATRFEHARLIGICAFRSVPVYTPPYTHLPAVPLGTQREYLEKELAAAGDRFSSALRETTAALEWRSTVTDAALSHYMAEQMRAADVLITAPQESDSLFDVTSRVDVADLILRAGRPVLIVNPGVDRLDLQDVVIAWKDTREARRAVADALPLLKYAERVTVVEVTANADLPLATRRTKDVANWLARYGIAASARAEDSRKDDVTQLADVVRELSAGMLVGGAYGHGRVFEWVLGGVTKELLLRPPRCAFVAH